MTNLEGRVIRRRRAVAPPPEVRTELEVLTSPADIAAACDDFLRMMRESRSDKANFMTERMERFFRRFGGPDGLPPGSTRTNVAVASAGSAK